MRALMINDIAMYGWLDSFYKRGDNAAENFIDYKSWLESLDDQELLFAYNRMRERIADLD